MLRAEGIDFAYAASRPLLVDWTEELRAGEVVCMTGPSGRGKSTLLYILGLMLSPSRGQVLLDGRPVSGASDSERARLRAHQFGFVFQDAALDASRTVLENVLETSLYRRRSRRADLPRARQLLKQFGVDVPEHAKPTQVSGGQAQRIALCRALLSGPRVVLADEPTGNLDEASGDLVVDALRSQAAQGSAVMVVTHDPRLVARCDREVRL